LFIVANKSLIGKALIFIQDYTTMVIYHGKKLVKKIAFIVLVLAFLIVAPLLILNTQGYRLDLKK